MIKIYPNFFNDEDFNRIISTLDRTNLFPVPNSVNTNSCRNAKFKVKDIVEQFGILTFQELLVYGVGGKSYQHIDGGTDNNQWNFTGILICNDTYGGGELNFSNLGIVIKPPKNTFIIFPAGKDSEIYKHGVDEVTSGERITAVFRFC